MPVCFKHLLLVFRKAPIIPVPLWGARPFNQSTFERAQWVVAEVVGNCSGERFEKHHRSSMTTEAPPEEDGVLGVAVPEGLAAGVDRGVRTLLRSRPLPLALLLLLPLLQLPPPAPRPLQLLHADMVGAVHAVEPVRRRALGEELGGPRAGCGGLGAVRALGLGGHLRLRPRLHAATRRRLRVGLGRGPAILRGLRGRQHESQFEVEPLQGGARRLLARRGACSCGRAP
mmetsp:Transcript_6218/g.16623  ORF Transcript_6218/g.16623 Transcript_6218/m.16623 type:complete len:229 (+) Transcript_6218:763-1449(+)